MSPDQITGTFEFTAACFTLLNVRRLLIDKYVAGVSVWPVAFFTAWGVWNTFYFFPHLGLWWSFAGSVCICAVNAWQIWLMIYFSARDSVNWGDLT